MGRIWNFITRCSETDLQHSNLHSPSLHRFEKSYDLSLFHQFHPLIESPHKILIVLVYQHQY